MPITVMVRDTDHVNSRVGSLTLIDVLQLGNDVQTDVGVFVLEHLEEHRKEMSNSPAQSVRSLRRSKLWVGCLLTLLFREVARDR